MATSSEPEILFIINPKVLLNGHSDDWISPELIIRRLVYAKLSHSFSKMQNNNEGYYQNIVEKNFDNPDKIIKYLKQKNRIVEKQTLLFNHPEFLRS